MKQKVVSEVTEEAMVENATVSGKKPNIALVGIKKGTVAAKQAATKIASAPVRLFDSAVYGACYGVSYGAVFTSLVIANMLPANSLIRKGFHDGSEVAHKDFVIRQEKAVKPEDKTVVA